MGIPRFADKLWKCVKPIESLLITLSMTFAYVVLGVIVFVNFGVPLELQEKILIDVKVQAVIDTLTNSLLVTLNQSHSSYSNAYGLIQFELLELRDKMFEYTGFTTNESKWGISEAAVHSLCLMTAIGSCVTTPPTTISRSIGILYGMVGLPLAVMTIGNVGKHIGRAAARVASFIAGKIAQLRKKKPNLEETVDLNDNKIPRVTVKLVFAMFFIYLLMGVAFLHDFKEENFILAMYHCFISLTTVAISNPHTYSTLTYLLFGLALTTVALEVASDYLRKVHFMGKKLRDACSVPIHFGGKDLSVAELLWAFGRENGLPDEVLLKFVANMDFFVSSTIALKESGDLRKPNVLLLQTVEAEHLGVSEISFADGSESE